jgi:uncharacterized protein YecA (UPF0149 family)
MANSRQRRQDVNDQFEFLKRSFEISHSEPDNAEPEDTDADMELDETSQTPLTERTQYGRPQTIEIARNAPCPCNSGKKYKRCCGVDAPPLYNAA